ncbi:MAG: class I SAM-dependent methyltransferase [Planctomycetota bacterium]|nr:class I SAM-dependent methyltransferase [Planctomycetota bacterium]
MDPHPDPAGTPVSPKADRVENTGPPCDLYRLAAPIYDACTTLWSGRAIWRSRRCQIENMAPGSRALYAGGGQGRAAIVAARSGVRVTYVDRSPAMIRIARKLAKRQAVSMDFVQADLMDWQPDVPFDHVVANHFLNVFAPPAMRAMRNRLSSFLGDAGAMHVADFRPLVGSRLLRALQRLHHIIPLSGCAALTRNAMHPIYDHGLEMERLGWTPVRIQDHRIWGLGPGWYRTWQFERMRQMVDGSDLPPRSARIGRRKTS